MLLKGKVGDRTSRSKAYLKKTASPEVIIITAVGNSSYAAKANQNRACDYLIKPFKYILPRDLPGKTEICKCSGWLSLVQNFTSQQIIAQYCIIQNHLDGQDLGWPNNSLVFVYFSYFVFGFSVSATGTLPRRIWCGVPGLFFCRIEKAR